MGFIKTKIEEHVLHIILDRGKSNAMDINLVEELITEFSNAEDNPSIEGVILTGKESFFSSGLDLIELYNYDEQQMKNFWQRFMFLAQKLSGFPKPFVTAITGHSPAGGCVLALCADYRIMAEGEFIIGLNEVPVGLVVPESIFDLYSFWLGEAVAYRSLLEGKLFNPSEALQVGLVDEVVPFNKIQQTAIRKLKSFSQFNRSAWGSSKTNFKKKLVAKLNHEQDQVIDQVLKQWWNPQTRAIMKTIIDNLTAKKN